MNTVVYVPTVYKTKAEAEAAALAQEKAILAEAKAFSFRFGTEAVKAS